MPQEAVRVTRVRKFTPQLLLFLQLMAALLCVLAVSGPRLRESAKAGLLTAIVIDNGASMNATDISGGRLAWAISQARAIASRAAGSAGRFCIVTTSPAHVASGFGSDGAELERGLAGIAPTDASSDVAGAVGVAAAALAEAGRRKEPTQIVLITDAAWSPNLDAAVERAAGESRLSLLARGTPDAVDIGIANLSIERDPADPEAKLQVLVRACAYGESATGRIELIAAGGAIASRRVDLAPDRPATVVFEIDAPSRAEGIVARIRTDAATDLASAATAYGVLPAAGSVRALLVSKGDPPLERVLGLIPGLRVDVASPANYAAFGAPSGYDMTILDGVPPAASRPFSGNALIWGGNGPRFVFADSAAGPQPVVDWNRADPVMRFVDLSNAYLTASAWSSVGSWRPLAVVSNGIVAADDEEGNRRQIRLSFEPVDSGLSAMAAFPILVDNAVSWLAGTPQQGASAGTAIEFAPIVHGWSVRGPAMEQRGVCDERDSPCSVANTLRAGIYSASSGGETLLFARNIDPASLDIAAKTHRISGFAMSGASSSVDESISVELTRIAAILFLAMLAIEWFAYHRPDKASRTAKSVRTAA
jgi:hypothetical protein